MIIVLLVAFGFILGSFVNALVWRFHEQAILAGDKAKEIPAQHRLSARKLSMSHGRSMCSNCHHDLAPKDLIPFFSWLYLHGKCRYCRQPIQDSPLVEVILPALFVVSYIAWPRPLTGESLYLFSFWLVFLIGFLALTAYDLRWYLLPDRIVFPLIGLALVELAGQVIFFGMKWQSLGGTAASVVIASGLFYVLYVISNGTWIGGGDVKLGIILGLLIAKPLNALLMLFLASLLGTFVSLPLLLRGKSVRKLQIPFGPYLLAATFTVVLYGQGILDAYTRFIGLT